MLRLLICSVYGEEDRHPGLSLRAALATVNRTPEPHKALHSKALRLAFSIGP